MIDASVDHEKGFMKSRENVDVYSTNEPQAAFNSRISFCLNIHNESVKVDMRILARGCKTADEYGSPPSRQCGSRRMRTARNWARWMK